MLSTREAAAGGVPALPANKLLQLGEIVGLFAVGALTIVLGTTLFGRGLVATVGSVWAANVLMLGVIYAGLRSRGQSWAHFGLHVGRPDRKAIGKSVLQSIVVFIAAIAAFVAGAILMANLVGMPQPADMSKYDYLQGNLAMTILALASVYVVSSFAEEVVYRGFLITRISELAGNGRAARYVAVIFSSLVFGLIHSDWGLTGMVQASCMGLALGASYLLVQRNLWVTILAHAYMDTILVLQMYFATN